MSTSKNNIIEIDDCMLIEILNKNCILKCYSKISKEDIDIVLTKKWCTNDQNYVVSRTGGKMIRLHRFIIGAGPNDEVDHINRDRLDNRRVNLRIVSHSDNVKNSSIRHDNSSGVRGVYWQSRTKRWYAQIRCDGKRINIGSFKDIEEARQSRVNAEREYHGLFSSLQTNALAKAKGEI